MRSVGRSITCALVMTFTSIVGTAATAPAHASGRQCSTTSAKLAAGRLMDNDWTHPAHAIGAGTALHFGHSYTVTGTTSARITWYGNSVTLTPGAQVVLSCYGLAKGQRADKPDLSLMLGTARVHATGLHPMAIYTMAALVGIATEDLGKTRNYSVREWHSATVWPHVVARVLSTTPRINITPYTGPQPGSCRVVTYAKLVYNANTAGSASYVLAK